MNVKTSAKKFVKEDGRYWIKVISAYFLLCASVAAFWIAYMTIFQQFIDERSPKLKLDQSPIGQYPGLAIRPRPRITKLDSSLIDFRSSYSGDWQPWVENLNNYIKPYQELGSGAGQYAQGDCNLFGERDPYKFCPFDLRAIPNECTDSQNFSFHMGKPCILIKLNRIFGWVPKPYHIPPIDYPLGASFQPGMIQITCEGRDNIDKENLGPVDYYPKGIDPKYFPYTNQPGYQSPFVMAHFRNPKTDVVIFVECKAWAQNLRFGINQTSSVKFELLIN